MNEIKVKKFIPHAIMIVLIAITIFPLLVTSLSISPLDKEYWVILHNDVFPVISPIFLGLVLGYTTCKITRE